MASSCFIARYDAATDQFTAIHCYWDGYPAGVGRDLVDFWHDDFSVKMLVNNGNLSKLGATLDECKSMDNQPSIIFKRELSMFEWYRESNCEYGYIWAEGGWYCYDLRPQQINLYTMENENA